MLTASSVCALGHPSTRAAPEYLLRGLAVGQATEPKVRGSVRGIGDAFAVDRGQFSFPLTAASFGDRLSCSFDHKFCGGRVGKQQIGDR